LVTTDDGQYQRQCDRIREIACAHLPRDATVIVLSGGDDELLQLGGRDAWHFPRTVENAYWGSPPADSFAAIAHLEALRARGGEFLLIPLHSFWWLDFYREFQRYLDTHYRRICDDPFCVTYRLLATEDAVCSFHRGAAQRLSAPDPPRVGEVDFGSLRRVKPISSDFGLDRGLLPIDRYYIETFLARHADDVGGHVLEIEDDFYTRRFGGSRVTHSDVLHVTAGNPRATIVADLTRADHIPANTFDCIILTQTLQFIYDASAAIGTLHRILKPGGVLLATFPGISQISQVWSSQWYWCFTIPSAGRLFEAVFPAENIVVEAHGNVLVATALLQGLTADELLPEELDHHDLHYQVLITVRAVKSL
jgi:SAM-dependent methyltransferase